MEQHNDKRSEIADGGCQSHTEHAAVNDQHIDKVSRNIEQRHHHDCDNHTVRVAVKAHQ